MLGVAKNLVKDVVQPLWQNFEKEIPTSCSTSKLPNFGLKEF
jgi:hypothetical protein